MDVVDPIPSAMGELKRIPHRQCGQALDAQLETAFPHGTSRTLAGVPDPIDFSPRTVGLNDLAPNRNLP